MSNLIDLYQYIHFFIFYIVLSDMFNIIQRYLLFNIHIIKLIVKYMSFK